MGAARSAAWTVQGVAADRVPSPITANPSKGGDAKARAYPRGAGTAAGLPKGSDVARPCCSTGRGPVARRQRGCARLAPRHALGRGRRAGGWSAPGGVRRRRARRRARERRRGDRRGRCARCIRGQRAGRARRARRRAGGRERARDTRAAGRLARGQTPRWTEQRVQFRGVATAGSVVIADATVAESGRYGHWAITLELEPGPNLMTFTMIDAVGADLQGVDPRALRADPGRAGPRPRPRARRRPIRRLSMTGIRPRRTRVPVSAPARSARTRSTARAARIRRTTCSRARPRPVPRSRSARRTARAPQSPDEHGSWLVTVYFPTAPSGQTFEVTASDGSNARTFSFVHSL